MIGQLAIRQSIGRHLRLATDDLRRRADELDQLSMNSDATTSAAIAKLLVLARQRCDVAAGEPGFFGSAGWNVLIDLMTQQDGRSPVSITSACIGSGFPATTALRHIAKLEAMGLVTITADPFDRRRRSIKLSVAGSDLVVDVLSVL